MDTFEFALSIFGVFLLILGLMLLVTQEQDAKRIDRLERHHPDIVREREGDFGKGRRL